MTTDVTVQGRALAQTGAVTLDDDTFTQPLCDLSSNHHHGSRRDDNVRGGGRDHNWTTN